MNTDNEYLEEKRQINKYAEQKLKEFELYLENLTDDYKELPAFRKYEYYKDVVYKYVQNKYPSVQPILINGNLVYSPEFLRNISLNLYVAPIYKKYEEILESFLENLRDTSL